MIHIFLIQLQILYDLFENFSNKIFNSYVKIFDLFSLISYSCIECLANTLASL